MSADPHWGWTFAFYYTLNSFLSWSSLFSVKMQHWIGISLWFSRVLKYPKKYVCRIWQHFSCLLVRGIWKKLNSHDGILPCLSLPSKSHSENSISSIFLESPHQVDIKNAVKSSKHFFGYFNTLETHSDLSWVRCNFMDWQLKREILP